MLEDEKNLINAARRGESEAFGRLYGHYLAPIYRFIYLKVSSKHEAEDLTHEVFLSAWRTMPAYKHKGLPFSSWLYQIARNRVIDYFRTKKINFSIDEVAENNFAIEKTGIDELLDTSLSLDKIRTAMEALEENQQTVLILRFIEDLEPREIADVVGKSEGAVRLMQYRALLRLKSLLQKSDDHE